MQRKISNTKKVRSGIYIQSRQKKLHSIPIINKVKSSVLYSIPCVKSCAHFCGKRVFILSALLLISIVSFNCTYNCYAACTPDGVCSGNVNDYTSISPVTGTTTTPATASISLSNTNMNQTTTPGSTATVSTNVTVSVGNAESYSLTLKMDSDKLTSGSTTINAGNATTDNTWGYSWNSATSYTAPSTSAKTLDVPSLSNGNASFTRELKFGVKFASNADSGHYKGSGTLSLVATPRASVITLANLTQMQQLSEGYAPEACANTPYLEGKNYSEEYELRDVRDNRPYKVRKLGDGKCWMTQDLKLWNANYQSGGVYTEGRTIKSVTSDTTSGTWTLPASSTSGFSDNAASNAYLSGSTGYYTWCAATAGTCSSATSNGANAPSSICPKGWKLPAGRVIGGNTTNDFYNLFKNMGLTVSDSLSATSTVRDLSTDDLSKIQSSPYNFAYTGQMNNSSIDNLSGQWGHWWSSTTDGAGSAYNLLLNANGTLSPGVGTNANSNGFAIRCVAE